MPTAELISSVARPPRAWIEKIFDFAIPEQTRRSDQALQARVLVGTCMLLAGMALLLTVPTVLSGNQRSGHMAMLLLASVVTYGLDVLLLRHSRSLRLPAILLLVEVLLYIDITAMATGTLDTVIMWTTLLPIVGIFLLGQKMGLLVAMVCSVNSGLIWLAALTGRLQGSGEFMFGSAMADRAVLSTCFIGFVAMVVGLFELARRRDILARDMAQAALLQATTAAQAANRAKSEFLANMSHEIRTPMNGVLGMLSLLEAEELSDTQRDYVAIAHRSAESLLALLNDILDLSRVEAGRTEIDPAPFDLCALIEEVVDQAALPGQDAEVELMVRYSPGTPSRLVGDQARIRQVLVNLVGNALKFTDRGHVLVAVERTSERDDAVTLEISVEDTGPGIPASMHELIFNKFQQADGSATRSHGGSGLGLAICRELVSLMGGRIGVESEEGKGARFWFTLPLPLDRDAPSELLVAPARGHGDDERVEGDTRARDGRVLVVEDNEVNQKVTRHLLARLGCQVDVASNGREALRMIQDTSYALVLMDMQMPEMDGLETTAAIRSREGGGHLPIVAMTARAMEGDRERCLAAGMDGYLSKPVEQGALAQVVARYLPPAQASALPERDPATAAQPPGGARMAPPARQ